MFFIADIVEHRECWKEQIAGRRLASEGAACLDVFPAYRRRLYGIR
jgi:hypothetical protein